MIEVIGVKRFVILVSLVLFNALVASVTYLYLVPEVESSKSSLRTLQGQVTSSQADLDKMLVEFDQLEQQQDRFDRLKEIGFFFPQTRSDAKNLFSKIQEDSKVISAVVNLKAGRVEESELAAKAKHRILVSEITAEVKAFDEIDVYRYLDMAEKEFPGSLIVDSMVMWRKIDINPIVIRSIANGGSPELVVASIKMSWKTMIPENLVIDDRR